MGWIILFVVILVGCSVYNALKKQNHLKQRELEQKETEHELNPDYVINRDKRTLERNILVAKERLDNAEDLLEKAVDSGDQKTIKRAQHEVEVSQFQLESNQAMKIIITGKDPEGLLQSHKST